MERIRPVVRRQGKKDFEVVDIVASDVKCTFVERGILKYRMKDGEVLSQISTVEEQQKDLERENFRKAERGYLVNMDLAEWYDDDMSQIHFTPHPERDKHPVPVSDRQRSTILRAVTYTKNAICQYVFNR
ncbi:hypothetical protein [Paenibacillus sp. P22]|uniref:hypothetical protein n=1 Tax=Paenibacillus sp. P22 TaxID=483908 RepID=UPI00038FB601|nr:hypothetical protein [Paenibacillus sp. P22]CDN42031.1 Response regulator of the LytR/AlgR family [Paenibacillus sp. P22]